MRGAVSVNHGNGQRTYTFEVQAFRQKHWIDEGVFEREELARAHATALLNSGEWEGTRILRHRHRAGGMSTQLEIYRKLLAKRDPHVAIGAVPTNTHVCRRAEDFFMLPSRMAIGRIFRHFLTEYQLTPLEVLHGHPHFQQLQKTGALVAQAILRVAPEQARMQGIDKQKRIVQLEAMVDDIGVLAHEAFLARRNGKLPAFNGSDPAAWAEQLRDLVGQERISYMANAILVLRLVKMNRLLDKLTSVLDLGQSGTDPEILAFIDRFAADVLAFPTVVQQIFGRPASRAHMICAMADYLIGRPLDGSRMNAVLLARITDLMERVEPSDTRAVLHDWIWRSLASEQPLDARDTDSEETLFARVLESLRLPDGQFLGGEATERALAERKLRARTMTLRRLGLDDVAARMADSWRSEWAWKGLGPIDRSAARQPMPALPDGVEEG